MDHRLPETSRKKLQAWFRYYNDLNVEEFYIDRRAMGKRSVKPPAISAEPAISLTARAGATASRIGVLPASALPVIQESSLFEAMDRVEGDTLELIRENLGECTPCRLHKQRNRI